MLFKMIEGENIDDDILSPLIEEARLNFKTINDYFEKSKHQITGECYVSYKNNNTKIVCLTNIFLIPINDETTKANNKITETFNEWKRLKIKGYNQNLNINPTLIKIILKPMLGSQHTVEVSEDGDYVMDSVPPGEYYLVAWHYVEKQSIFWSVPVQKKEGKQLKIDLNNSNAMIY